MSSISFVVPLLNVMKMKGTTRMKHVLSALTLSAALASPAWAVYHEDKPLAVEILSEGEIIHIHSEFIGSHNTGSEPLKFVDYHILYDDRYYTCQYNTNRYIEPVVTCVEVDTPQWKQ